ncbi:MAG: RNA methyltransferase [Acidobacteria bacterium]|nr:RNA methyltransferase [Acidobacteriota bacterium]
MPRRVQTVESLDHPALEPYRTLRCTEEHERRGIFVAEGAKVVERLFASKLEVLSALLTPEWQHRLLPEGAGFDIYVAPRTVLEQVVGFRLHQGAMAVARVPAAADWSQVIDEFPSPHLVVALDGIQLPENVGTIVRSAAAFGAHAVLHDGRCASPYQRRAVRSSMGAVFSIPVIAVPDLAPALARLHERRATRLVVADAHAEVELPIAQLGGDVAIVLGHEDSGASPGVRALQVERVAIPMVPGVDSLNVASAAAIFLHEARRNRGKGREAPR